jgi:SSS family solute:Na+ symporter
MAAGRSLPAWAVGLSIFGAYVSGISFVGNPGAAYADNWNAFVFAFSLPIAAWIAARYFVPFYRRTGEVSSYHHLEQRFGPWARTYSVACYVLIQTARAAVNMYLISLPVAALGGWDIKIVIIAMGALMTLLPLVGGTEAVIWTGIVQSAVLAIGLIACALRLLFGMPQGPSQLFQIAADAHKFSLGSWSLSLTAGGATLVLLRGLFINLQNFGIDQTYVQRYITARSDSAAIRSVWFGSLLYIPISAALFFIGTALFAYYRIHPDSSAAALASDRVFPHFITTQLPTGLAGLLVAAVCAAATDANFNCTSTLLLRDVYQRYFRPSAGDRESMAFLRLSILISGLVAIYIALNLIGVRSGLDAWWRLEGTFGGGMLGLFLLGRLFGRAGTQSAFLGVLAGVLIIAWMTYSPQLASLPEWTKSHIHGYWTPIFGTLAVIVIGGLISLLVPERPARYDAGEAGPSLR